MTLRYLNDARISLRRALEEHEGSGELDKLTRLILEAVRAITAARREALRDGAGNPGGDIHAGDRHPELRVVRAGMTQTKAYP